MSCCANHPDGCRTVGIASLIGLVLVAVGFGWRWAGLVMLIAGELDWLIRVWQFRAARGSEQG